MAQKPGYVRGVGLDVFEVFRRTMADLGWVMQIFCDWQVIGEMAPRLREIARDMPVIVDHYMMMPAARGVGDPNFQALLKLVGDGHAHVKVSAPYRVSEQFPDYADAPRAARGAGRSQSGAAGVGHRLAASFHRCRGHAGRRAFAGFVVRLDAGRGGAKEDFGGNAGEVVRELGHMSAFGGKADIANPRRHVR